jgi:hypothetical protein
VAQQMPRAEYLSTMQWARHRLGAVRGVRHLAAAWYFGLALLVMVLAMMFWALSAVVVIWFLAGTPAWVTVGAAALGPLAWCGLALRRATRTHPPNDFGPPFDEDDSGGGGVREPRRPIGPHPTFSAEVDPRG